MTKAQESRPLQGMTSLNEFLDQEGIRQGAAEYSAKMVIALQIAQEMKARKISKASMARLMQTSRPQLDRLLDPNAFNVTLETLNRAAKVVGKTLKLELS